MDDKFFLTMVDKFNSSNISELDFNDGAVHMVLKRESSQSYDLKAHAEGAAHAPAGRELLQVQASGAPQAHHTPAVLPGGAEMVKSPIVATFYSAPSPDAPPFVKQGTKVKKGQTLCILEAMKMINQLEAEFDCEVIDIHASNGELVEYGQELFTVKRD